MIWLINEREKRVENLCQFWRAMWQEMLPSILHSLEHADVSVVQMVTLYLLDSEGELTIKQVAEKTGRSLSACSRFLDQLVERGWVGRHTDRQDRRVKRVFLADSGREFLRTFEQKQADAQPAVMASLSPEEQAQIVNLPGDG